MWAGGLAQQGKGLGQIGAAFVLVLGFRRHAQGLAEVFLVQALALPAGGVLAVVARHQQVRPGIPALPHGVDGGRSHVELQGGSQRHAEALVQHAGFDVGDGGFEDVGAGGAKARQADAPALGHHGQFVLRTGQRQAQVGVARPHRAAGHVVDGAHQFRRVEPAHGVRRVKGQGRLARFQQRDGAGAFTADAVQQGKVVLAGDVQGLGHALALGAFGQQAGEEGARGTVIKCLRLQRQGLRQRHSGLVGQPVGRISESQPTIDLREGADVDAGQPDFKLPGHVRRPRSGWSRWAGPQRPASHPGHSRRAGCSAGARWVCRLPVRR